MDNQQPIDPREALLNTYFVKREDYDDNDISTAGLIAEFEAAGLIVSLPHVHTWTQPPEWVHNAAATIQFCNDCHGLHWVPMEIGG